MDFNTLDQAYSSFGAKVEAYKAAVAVDAQRDAELQAANEAKAQSANELQAADSSAQDSLAALVDAANAVGLSIA